MFRTLNRWWQRRKGNATKAIATSEQGIEAVQQPNEPAPSEWVAYDENLLERARTQWQFGDWESLAALSREILQHHPDRAKLALLAAAGHQQLGDMTLARQFTRLAQDWGASKKLISQVLIAGVHNTLGRASTFRGDKPRALKHFECAISTASQNGDARLVTKARIAEELESCSRKIKKNNINQITLEKGNEFSSVEYWENRYRDGGNSGYGSYGRLAEFKAEIINKFIEENEINDAIEFGCGDGNQLSKLKIKSYLGVDISKTAIIKCKNKFKNDPGKKFMTLHEFNKKPSKSQVTLSLDVIYHLVENEEFKKYINTLLDASNKYCVIYSSNEPHDTLQAKHIKQRNFTDWIKTNKKGWELIKVEKNRYPYKEIKDEVNSSISDFYFYQKKNRRN